MDLLLFLGLSVLAGTIGAALASSVWVLMLQQFRPNLEIAEQIERYEDTSDATVYHGIKVVNHAPRIAFDVEAELLWVDETPWHGGYLQYYKDIKLKRSTVRMMNRFDRKDTHGLYAFIFRAESPLQDEWTDSKRKLLFRVIATDPRSHITRAFSREYALLDDPIKDGRYKPNASMEIIALPLGGNERALQE